MIIIDGHTGQVAINPIAILSVTETDRGWKVDFAGDRPSRIVNTEPATVSTIPALPGTELWRLDRESEEFSRHAVIGWTVKTGVITGTLIERRPILSVGSMLGMVEDEAVVVDTVIGMASALDPYAEPTSDVEGFCQAILEEWRSTPLGKARAKQREQAETAKAA